MKRNHYLLISLIAGLIAVGLYYVQAKGGINVKNAENVSTSTPQEAPASSAQNTYTNTQNGFSIEYPKDMKVDEGYKYENTPDGKSIPGVAFEFPAKYHEGTNLSNDSRIAVEWKKDLTSCTPQEFTGEPANGTFDKTINGAVWHGEKTNGAGAGNFYQEVLYTKQFGQTCFNLRLFLHSTNIGNYEPGTKKEFDQLALESLFEQMSKTFTYQGKAAPK